MWTCHFSLSKNGVLIWDSTYFMLQLNNLNFFYTWGTQVIFLNPTVFARPTLAPHTLSPFFAVFVMREKPCGEWALYISIAYVITRVIILKFSFHVWFTRWLLYAYFILLWRHFLFVPNNLFIAGFFDSERNFFSWHSRNCFLQGEAVNSFAQHACDCFAWYMGAEHFGVWWGMGRTSAGPSHHWRCGKKCLIFPVLKFHCHPSVRLSWDSPNLWHANSLSWNICLLQGKWSSFYKWVYLNFHCCSSSKRKPEQLANYERRNNTTILATFKFLVHNMF